MKNFNTLLKILCFVSFPAFFGYLGSSNSLLDYWQAQKYLGENFNINLFKHCLLIIGIVMTNVYINVRNEITRRKYLEIESQRSALINQLKVSTLYYLESILQDEHVCTIRFNVYCEKKNILYIVLNKIASLLGRDVYKYFLERKINGLTDCEISNLCYEITPIMQGIVGLCYLEKEIKYEEDLSQTLDNYAFSDFQLSRLRSIKFCLCAPIFNTNNEIVSIISLESIHCIRISIDAEQQLAIAITNFCQTLYQNCPELFK